MLPLLADHDTLSSAQRLRGFRDHASRLDKLAAVLFEYYSYAGPIELLSVVKQLSETHHRLLILSDPDSISALSIHLADIYLAEHQLRHDLDSLELSLKYYRRALDDEELPNCQHLQAQVGLAYASFYRFLAWDTHEDCRTAVRLIDDALGRVDEFDNDQISRAKAIAYAVLIKASAPTRMVMITPLEDTLNMLPSLSEALGYRLSRSLYITCLVAQARLSLYLAMTASQVVHVQAGIIAATKASQLCSEDAVFMKHFTLTSLVTLYFRARYDDKDGSDYYRDAAVEIAEAMLSMTELMLINSYVHCYWLHCWGDAVMDRAVRREHLDIMEQVVETYKQAIEICPPSHNIRRMLVTNHIASLGQYFEHSGRVSILDEGIALAHRLGPDAAMNIPYLACNVAEYMIMRARINDSKNARMLISRAIHLCQSRMRAEGYPHDDMERISMDMHLISASRMQVQLGGDAILDIDTILHITLTGLSESHEPALRTACILTRTEALVARARNHDDTSSLVTAQLLLDEELSSALTAPTIFSVDLLAEKANVLIAQSDLMSRISVVDRQNLLTSAWDCYLRAVTASVGRARERFQASLKWAASAANRGNYSEALKAYAFAVNLLPQVVFRGEDVLGRIEALRQVSGLAASSVAMALRVEDVSASILFLEQTRGILWLQTSRVQASDLDRVPPDLKERFINASLNLERSDKLKWATQRAEAAELDSITVKIRELPGFERFLLPPCLQDLEQALNNSGGYAAVVVPNDDQCIVLLFGVPEGHRVVRLPDMDIGRIFSLGRDFIFECSTTRASMRKMTQSHLKTSPNLDISNSTLLSELWTRLVRPVIMELGIQSVFGSPKTLRPRLWWCPIGALGSLPLHAAGVYEGSSQDNISNYLISSYTPTLTSLHRMLSTTPTRSGSVSSPRLLLVGQTDSADLPSLPNAQIEIEQLREIVSPNNIIKLSTTADDRGASIDTVLRGVSDAHVIHLACHGHQDQENPLNSGFDLQDGRLTLGQLMRVRTPNAQFAYLSACESAGMDESRPDEGLNLAGAMIFVGFRSVIGTMWAMNDLDGPFIAERVYKRILREEVLDLDAIPTALDDAVRDLRETGAPASRWATYVHFGV